MSILSNFNLTDKSAFVTGASKGIGKAIARALAEAGARVTIAARNSNTLVLASKELQEFGLEIGTIELDFEDVDTLEKELDHVTSQFGHISILVNNVGGRRTNELLEEQSLSSWKTSLDRNLTSAFVCMKHFGAEMIHGGQGGRIINVASMNAFIANRGIGNRCYETSKAALVQLTKAAAADWASHGITVNAICPGLIMTESNTRWAETNPAVIEALISGTPMGRAGTPEEIAGLALFLASPASSFITGAIHIADGGYTLW